MKYATRAIAYGHVSNKHLEELNQKNVGNENEESKGKNKIPQIRYAWNVENMYMLTKFNSKKQ